ncbi:MAG TPA: hypothetical protein VK906_00645 [Egicoccus sp.]|nr:hypothetical protein [Egicoccus sp.]HSK21647.1 hypothetical protein [Egicoccus sp.]
MPVVQGPPTTITTPAPAPGPERTPTTPQGGFARRQFFSGTAGVGAGLLLAGWWYGRRPEPVDEHGLPLAEVDLGDAEVLAEHAADGPVLHPTETGRLAVLRWEPRYRSRQGWAFERYGPDGEDHPILDDDVGLMVVSVASPHCGCLVGWCETSRWFEGPCHGSRFNRWGEWTGGPAPRGLDRYHSRIEAEGHLVASLTHQIVGVHRDAGLLEQSPEGPACV